MGVKLYVNEQLQRLRFKNECGLFLKNVQFFVNELIILKLRNQILSSSLAYLIIFLLVYCVYKNSEVSLLYYSLNKNLFIFGLLIHTTIFYFKRQSGVYIIRIPEFYWSHC